MRERLAEIVEEALRTLVQEAGGDPSELPTVALELPRQKEHGDFACNAALVLGKRLGRPPRELAARLVDLLTAHPGLVARAEVAGPGFVNLWLAESRWQSLLGGVLARPAEFGRGDARKGQRVQVEFVSANPTGPLSIGHGRQAVLGDCIARLLDATGAEVVTRSVGFLFVPTESRLADHHAHKQDLPRACVQGRQ